MRVYSVLALGPLAWLLAACGHALPSLPGFDAAAWRRDPYACHDRRAALLPPLQAARARLYEARADDVTALLGPPDEEELYAETQKAYTYYLRPGPQCGPRHPHATGPGLHLRFGPLGTVTEVQLDPLAPPAP